MKKSNILTLLASIFIAFAMWLYVITVVSPGSEETIDNIPVILRNEANLNERGFMVISEELPTVTLTLSGNRTDLAKVDRSNISLIVDLSTVSERGTHKLSYKPSFPGSVAEDAITIESRSPGTIELQIELLTKKDVPVVLDYEGNVAEDFIADKENVLLDSPTIHIEGPDPVVQKITQAVITVDLEGKTENVAGAYRYTLCDAQGQPVDAAMITTDVSEVNMMLKVYRYKEIDLVFDVIYGGGATEETAIIEYEPKTLNIAGSEAALAAFTDKLVLGTIDLTAIMEDTVLSFPVTLPGDLTNLSNLETVEVSVAFPDLKLMDIYATQFEAINVPEGLEAEVVTRVLQVKVRGPQDLVEKMRADSITVVVDLSEASTAGAYTVDATIEFPPEYAQVGALGTYKDKVTVKLVDPENNK